MSEKSKRPIPVDRSRWEILPDPNLGKPLTSDWGPNAKRGQPEAEAPELLVDAQSIRSKIDEALRALLAGVSARLIDDGEDFKRLTRSLVLLSTNLLQKINTSDKISEVSSINSEALERISNFLRQEFRLSADDLMAISYPLSYVAEAAARFGGRSNENFVSSASQDAWAEPLCEPQGQPELYEGKGKSGEIYAFLQRVYPYREDASPLTTGFLQEHDPKALQAFRNRKRIVPVPVALQSLTREGQPSTMNERLAAHNVNLSTPDGVAEAKKLASAITKLVYGPK